MYTTILVPIDGSESSMRAAREARMIAKTYDADVHLLSIVDVRNFGLGAPGGETVSPAIEQPLSERAETALEEAAAVFDEDTPVTTEIRHGTPAADITAYAEQATVDLIVMGTTGLTGVDRIVLGSVAERVLRQAPVPVITVREDAPETDSYERILLPTDGSDHAKMAAEHAIDIASQYGALLYVVGVLDLQEIGGIFDAGGLDQEFVERHEQATREDVDEIGDRAAEAEVDVRTTVTRGTPHEEICAYADESDIDVIVMGTHGRSGVRRALLGSVTESTVRNAPCPVCSIRQT